MSRAREPGRPSKLTPELEKQYIELVREGCPFPTACDILRINKQTIHNWRIRSESGEEPFASFFENVAAAKGQDVAEAIKLWKESNAENKDPRWLSRYIEQLHDVAATPKVKQVEVTHQHQLKPAYDVSMLTETQFKNWCECLEAMRPTQPEPLNTIDVTPRLIESGDDD
jgi:hypothetical protein